MKSIDTNTMKFLKTLRNNNNREWFSKNKPKYELAKENATVFANELVSKLNSHDHIEGAKVFRIYRDVRFSKDKTPYKSSIGIGFKRATEKLRGGCYVNIEPGNSFVGGGFWGPNPADLKRVRNELAADAKDFRKIINSASFKKYFGHLEGDAVKTAPKGFDKQHENIDLIRMKQFLLTRRFSDKEVVADNFLQECNKTFKAMRPFFDYMSHVLTTNENGESIV